jgi:hypothetical protein
MAILFRYCTRVNIKKKEEKKKEGEDAIGLV